MGELCKLHKCLVAVSVMLSKDDYMILVDKSYLIPVADNMSEMSYFRI